MAKEQYCPIFNFGGNKSATSIAREQVVLDRTVGTKLCRLRSFFCLPFEGFQVKSARCVDLLFAKTLLVAENCSGLEQFVSLFYSTEYAS